MSRADPVPISVDLPRPRWEWFALALLLALAAGLRLWELDQNGFGNAYYAAAVRSMLASPSNFFFGAFDPTGLVTVDKPPLALWIQAAFAKILGYRGVSILLPQALMGTLCVAVLYGQVRRVFGGVSALTAAGVLAVTPVAVAVDRDNLPDTMLTLLLTLAAGSLARAAETGRLSSLLTMAAIVGAAFNVKMVAAYVVLPAFYIVYFLAAPIGWLRRLVHLAAATTLLLAVSLSWAVLVDFTPKEHRPYIGSSGNNSAVSLAVGYNGLGRVLGGRGNVGRKRRTPSHMPSAPTDGANPGADASALRSWLGEPGRAGLLRFAGAPLAEQITWLMPLAFFAAVAVLIRSSASSERIATWIWAGWLVTYWGVLSFAKGIFHNYYSVVMGPAIAALVGIGLPALWRAVRSSTPQRLLLPVALLVTGVWQAHVLGNHGQLSGKFIPFVIGGTALAAVALLAGRALAKWSPQISWEELGLELGLFAVLLAPATWSVTTVLWPGSGMFPAANADIITRAATKQQMKLLRNDLPAESVTKLVDFLSQRQSGVDYLLATLRSDEVAPIIVHSGAPVIAFGGFRGADQIFSKDAFIELVRSGRLRYVLVGATEPDAATHDSAPPATNAADSVLGQNREIVEWVRERGSLVEPSLWKLEGSHVTKDGWIPGFGPLGRAAQLFDLQSAITIPNNQTEGSSRRES